MSYPLLLAVPDVQTIIASAGAIGIGVGVGVGSVYAAFHGKKVKSDLDAYKLYDEARRESISMVLGETERRIGKSQERLDEVAAEVRGLREEVRSLRVDLKTMLMGVMRKGGLLAADDDPDRPRSIP